MSISIVTLSKETLALDKWTSDAAENVKSQPGEADARWQLIKLYCVQADWERAIRQLDTVIKVDPASQRQVDLYRNLILSERLRIAVLAGEREAIPLQQPLPEWATLLQTANKLYTQTLMDEAEDLRQQALDQAEPLAGQSDGLGQFDWLADGDDRLGPVCEFICAGGYRWVPFSEIASLTVSAPAGLNDMVWAPATLVVNGDSWRGYLPARYPVDVQDDPIIKTGLETQWVSEGARFLGRGRKMWSSSVGEASLFEAGVIDASLTNDHAS